MLEGEREKLLRMEDELAKRVVGQAEAVHAVSTAVRRARAGLQAPNRPIGSFMFLGPTGVGKTELTKAVAAFLFDDETAMIRIDMSEYMEKHAVSRLIGAPPGYVGYEEGGQLTEAVRRHPYSVVLFDEIEKAHPDVFNMLLQVLDDGRLTDNKGRTVDFKNTVVIMTSNVGAELIPDAETMEKDYDAVEDRLMGALRQTFRPEFLNRIDETIVFHGLGRAELAQIAELLLEHLRRQVEGQGMHLEVSEEALRFVADSGYDPQWGARPLKRAIQRLVENPLSREILGGAFAEGDTVRVEVQDGALVFLK